MLVVDMGDKFDTYIRRLVYSVYTSLNVSANSIAKCVVNSLVWFPKLFQNWTHSWNKCLAKTFFPFSSLFNVSQIPWWCV